MEIGIQEIALAVLACAVVAGIVWGTMRWRRTRYTRIKTKLRDVPEYEVDEYGAELPSGGAKVVAVREDLDVNELNDRIRAQVEANRPTLKSFQKRDQVSMDFGDAPPVDDDAEVPMLLEPAEDPESVYSPPADEESMGHTASRSGEADPINDDDELPSTPVYADQDDSFDVSLDAKPESSNLGDGEKNTHSAETAREKPELDPVEVIIINLVSRTEEGFYGIDVRDSALANDLSFGDMGILHYVPDAERGLSVFSVANMVKPGTFPWSHMEDFSTPGLSFFQPLYRGEKNMQNFEHMLNTARGVAVYLSGDLNDEQRSVLTGQTIEHYRTRIADFERRCLVSA